LLSHLRVARGITNWPQRTALSWMASPRKSLLLPSGNWATVALLGYPSTFIMKLSMQSSTGSETEILNSSYSWEAIGYSASPSIRPSSWKPPRWRQDRPRHRGYQSSSVAGVSCYGKKRSIHSIFNPNPVSSH
jgi:hypothetical protein